MKSKRVAGKGLELACFVAERLGSWPDETGAYAFSWTPEDESDVEEMPESSLIGKQVRTTGRCLCLPGFVRVYSARMRYAGICSGVSKVLALHFFVIPRAAYR